jgi:hypothetical protein
MRRVTTNTLRAWIGLRQRSMRAAILAPWRDARGVAAVEFAFVMPVLVLILTGIIQLGMLLFLHGNMGNVARDTARRLAVGELTAANAPSYAEGQLVNWGGTFTVTPTMPNPADPNDRDITVQISVPIADVSLVDIVGVFRTGNMTAASTMRQE